MHTVKLKIEEEKDLYDPFDPDGESLSGDVKAYIVDRMPERKLGDDIELQIIAAEPLDRERLKRAFCHWYDEEEKKAQVGVQKKFGPAAAHVRGGRLLYRRQPCFGV